MKAKHAFGALERVDENIKSGVIDSFDVLFVKDSEGKPYVGWVSKNGQKEIVDPYAEVSKLEAQIETEMAKKANADEIKVELAEKANTVEVNEKIDKVATESIATANAYTDEKVEAAVKEHLVKKFEISGTPDGTLVDYRDGEIRILCRENAEFSEQSVGAGGDPKCFYCTLKTYVFDDNVVGYREHLSGQVDEEILKDLKTDKFGRRYQPTWLALARLGDDGNWSYYGKNSSEEHMIGFDYQIDFYDADDVMIGSDSVRINLSNEECHFINEPYYVGKIRKEVDTKIEEKIAEVEASYEIVEF